MVVPGADTERKFKAVEGSGGVVGMHRLLEKLRVAEPEPGQLRDKLGAQPCAVVGGAKVARQRVRQTRFQRVAAFFANRKGGLTQRQVGGGVVNSDKKNMQQASQNGDS